MKLFNTDADAPSPEADDPPPRATPPRPEHRRVAVSFLFTIAILAGTVISIYAVFPARNGMVVSEAVAEHRAPTQTWQIAHPSPAELDLWTLAVLGESAPLPRARGTTQVVGARPLEILGRRAVFVRYLIGADAVSVLVQRARDLPPRRISRRDDDDQVESWRVDKWTVVAVGPAASAAIWRPVVGVP
jgi:hypothetical protein